MVLRKQAESLANGGQHSQGQTINLQDAEGFHVILVPLDDGPLGHGRILKRHELGERSARDHEAADVLGKMTGKPQEFGDEPCEGRDLRRLRIEAGLADPLRKVALLVMVDNLGQAVHAIKG